MEILGLSEDELCRTLDADPLTLLSGQLEHRPELPILLTMLDEALAECRRLRAPPLGPGRRPGRKAGRLPSLGRDFTAFEDALAEFAADGFVLRARGREAIARWLSPSSTAMRVRYAECDAQGVVFNAHYLAYVDDTITAMWRAAFGSYQVMLDRGVDIVVAEAHLRFLGAARFDEEIEIEAAVTHLGTTSLRTHYRFLRDGELLLEAPRCATCSSRRGRSSKTPIPDWARIGLERWLLPELGSAAAAAG